MSCSRVFLPMWRLVAANQIPEPFFDIAEAQLELHMYLYSSLYRRAESLSFWLVPLLHWLSQRGQGSIFVYLINKTGKWITHYICTKMKSEQNVVFLGKNCERISGRKKSASQCPDNPSPSERGHFFHSSGFQCSWRDTAFSPLGY